MNINLTKKISISKTPNHNNYKEKLNRKCNLRFPITTRATTSVINSLDRSKEKLLTPRKLGNSITIGTRLTRMMSEGCSVDEEVFMRSRFSSSESKKNENFEKKNSKFEDDDHQYFHDDEKMRTNHCYEGEILDEQPLYFSFKHYMKYFMISFLYLGLLGPFMLLSIPIKPKLRFMFNNLKFTRTSSIEFYTQNFYFLSSFCTYFAWYNKLEIFDFALVKILVLGIIFRSVTIAGRYASFSRQKLFRYEETYVKEDELRSESMTSNWMKQSRKTVLTELESSLKTKEIDPSLFKMAFFSEISRKTQKKISKFQRKKNLKFFKKRKMEKLEYFEGKDILIFLINESNNSIKSSKMFFYLIIGLTSILYSSIPNLIHYLKGTHFLGSTNTEAMISFIIWISDILLWSTTLNFFYQSISDLRRRNFLLKQISQILSPKKKENISKKKLLPTLNLVDTISMDSWINMRKAVLTYGEKFIFRQNIFLPVIVIACFSSLIGFFMIEVQTCHDGHQGPLGLNPLKKLQFMFFVDFMLFFTMIFSYLFTSAKINSHFGKTLKILNGCKEIFNSLQRHKKFYFKKNFNERKFRKREYDFLDSWSKSFIHRRLTKEVLRMVRLRWDTDPEDVLEEIEGLNDQIIRLVEWEEKYDSLKILGFFVSNAGVFNFLFAFIGILLTTYEILYT